MHSRSAVAPVNPFLLRFAVPRSADTEMPGHYCDQQKVWVVDEENGERPIIEVAGGSLVSTQTKTMSHVETDDDDPTRFGTSEMGSLARSPRRGQGANVLLRLPEIMTKTEVQQERDDEAKSPYC